MGIFDKLFGKERNKMVKSEEYFRIGVKCDNSGDMEGAINNYSKAISLNKHPMALYCRACVYKHLGKYKEAIEDFKGYLKYGPSSSSEAIASKITIEELEREISRVSSIKGERSNVLCPRCKNNFIITARNVNGFFGSQKLECPNCGSCIIKLRP
jgi:tetratricopeptide (TPR) repeat protein